MSASGKNKGRQIFDRNRAETNSQMNRKETGLSVRQSRHGYRGTAMFQLTKNYSQEGILVVDVGGPPVVGS